ncbi:MAG: hypothetical protein KTR15_00965 [Phycisphaeraceae bacterium]|nr:hypothetical protein [Phycisphaeraceae bacterium]
MKNLKHTMTRFGLVLALIALSACASGGSRPSNGSANANNPLPSKNMNTVTLLGFEGCSLTPLMRSRAEAAIEGMSLDAQLVVIDQNELEVEDLRRGYPAPTLLVNGRDLYGMQPPTSPAMSCRVYQGPDNVPSVADLATRLQVVFTKNSNTQGGE